MAPTEKILLNRQEAADLLSVSKRTLDNLLAQGSLECVRIGRRVLIPKEQLQRLAASLPKSRQKLATGRTAKPAVSFGSSKAN